jgi:hypothetical protein
LGNVGNATAPRKAGKGKRGGEGEAKKTTSCHE